VVEGALLFGTLGDLAVVVCAFAERLLEDSVSPVSLTATMTDMAIDLLLL
jgi:hypothetical protein